MLVTRTGTLSLPQSPPRPHLLPHRMGLTSSATATTRYRLGYVTVNASAVVLIGNIPGTFLWDPEAGETADGGAFAAFLATVALSALAFFTVQVRERG